MKNITFVALLALGLMLACKNQQGNTQNQSSTEKENQLTVSGRVTKIESGKDGYTATVQDASGKSYLATISIINLQKSGGTFKRHEIGDEITVSGPFWKDDQDMTYITVKNLK